MENDFNSIDAFLITSIALYSTGHWIGGTVALVIALIQAGE